jgi:hypothetical protein
VRGYLVAVVGVTTLESGSTVAFLGFELRWFFLVVVAAGVAAMILVHPTLSGRALTVRTGVVAVIATLVGPALFSYSTVRSGHAGSGPMAGPGRAAYTTEPVAPRALGGSFLGADAPIPDAVVTTLAANSAEYRWAAATLGARAAAAYQLRVGAPVLAIGGYKGTDPMPTLDQFIAMVHNREIHWFIPGGIHGLEGTRIEAWVRSHLEPTPVAGYILYNLDMPTAATAPPPQVITAGGVVL